MIEDGVVDVDVSSIAFIYDRKKIGDGGCLKIFASLIFQLAARWTRHHRSFVRVCI
jgi:hypothetical protein